MTCLVTLTANHSDALEQEFRERTVGLVSAEDFRKAREVVDNAKIESMQIEREAADRKHALKMKNKAEKRKRMISALSFDADVVEDEEASMTVHVPKRVAKNPDVDTSHLPDRERDECLQRERDKLRAEWLQQQEVIKQEVCASINDGCWCVTSLLPPPPLRPPDWCCRRWR